MDKDNRHSLTIRIQARNGTPLSRVIHRLNSMSKEEKRQEIINLLMASLPYALEMAEENPDKIEQCYWDTQKQLFYSAYFMKQALGIKSEPPSEHIFGTQFFFDKKITSGGVEPESITEAEEELDDDLEDTSFMLGVSM